MREVYRFGDEKRAKTALPSLLSAWQAGNLESWRFTPLHTSLTERFSDISLVPTSREIKLTVEKDGLYLDVFDGASHLKPSDLASLHQEGIQIYGQDHQVAKLMLYDYYGYIVDHNSPLNVINTAYGQDVLVLSVKEKTSVQKTLYLRFHTDNARKETMPRVLVVLEQDAALELVEEYVSLKSDECVVPVVEVVVGNRARMSHYKLQAMADTSTHLALTGVQVARNARYQRILCQTGAKLARDEIKLHCVGSHSDVDIAGMYIGKNQQHLDQTITVRHQDEATSSRQMYKGVLAHHARGVFQGKIHVDQKAQQTDGYQINRTVTLADTAWMHAKPELEIYADDVKCSHGSIVGSLDPEELYYLCTRGIDANRAKKLLLQAHMDQVLSTIQQKSIQRQFFHHIEKVLATLSEQNEPS